MIKIGLTGGIGSGKSFISKIFQKLGIPVFYADEESKKILDTIFIQQELKKKFGASIILNNKIDKDYLSSVKFSNRAALKFVESLLHTKVHEKYIHWLQKQNAEFIIKEAAILFESGTYKNLDIIIAISASQQLRKERVMKRDSMSKENVFNRIKHQWTDSQREAKSHYVIYNDEKEMLMPQIIKIYEDIKQKTNR